MDDAVSKGDFTFRNRALAFRHLAFLLLQVRKAEFGDGNLVSLEAFANQLAANL